MTVTAPEMVIDGTPVSVEFTLPFVPTSLTLTVRDAANHGRGYLHSPSWPRAASRGASL